MSEHQNYYDNFARASIWANRDENVCGCKGSGWWLSELDTCHQCPFHFCGQPDPESEEEPRVVCRLVQVDCTQSAVATFRAYSKAVLISMFYEGEDTYVSSDGTTVCSAPYTSDEDSFWRKTDDARRFYRKLLEAGWEKE